MKQEELDQLLDKIRDEVLNAEKRGFNEGLEQAAVYISNLAFDLGMHIKSGEADSDWLEKCEFLREQYMDKLPAIRSMKVD